MEGADRGLDELEMVPVTYARSLPLQEAVAAGTLDCFGDERSTPDSGARSSGAGHRPRLVRNGPRQVANTDPGGG